MKFEKKIILFAILIFLLSLIIYSYTFNNDILNWDDDIYIIKNEMIKDFSLNGIKRIFTSIYHCDYLPLTQLSFLFDYHFWKLNPVGYHLTNSLFHAANALLVFILFSMIFGDPFIGAFSSFFFIIHPLNVESVAWITERKTVLSIFFLLIAFIFFIKYIKKDKKRYYTLSLISYIFACLAKSLVVVFPFLLLLYEICFIRDKIKFKNKIPFFILGIATALMAIYTQGRAEAIKPYHGGSLSNTFMGMSIIVMEYFKKLVLPLGLNCRYPNIFVVGYHAFSKAMVLVIAIAVASFFSFKRNRIIFFCFGWFFISFAPVSNIIPIANMMADRYMYLPSLSLFALAGLGFKKLWDRFPFFTLRFILAFLFIIYSVFLITLSIDRTKVWRNNITLWQDSINKCDKNSLAYHELGRGYLLKNEIDKAIKNFKKAIEIDPRFYLSYYGLAEIYMKRGEYQRAIENFKKGLKYNPDNPLVITNLGVLYFKTGKYEKALTQYKKVLAIEPDSAKIYKNLGILYLYGFKDNKKAIYYIEKSLKLSPTQKQAKQMRLLINKLKGEAK